MARPTKPLNLMPELKELLEGIVRSRETPHSLVRRTQIILKAAAGYNNKTISQDLGLWEDTVGLWRKRWIERTHDLERFAGKSKELRREVSKILADKPRPGSPGKFRAEQVCQVIALACETLPSYLSHWTRKQLVHETLKRTTVGRFLTSG